jgi:hypothetical protein
MIARAEASPRGGDRGFAHRGARRRTGGRPWRSATGLAVLGFTISPDTRMRLVSSVISPRYTEAAIGEFFMVGSSETVQHYFVPVGHPRNDSGDLIPNLSDARAESVRARDPGAAATARAHDRRRGGQLDCPGAAHIGCGAVARGAGWFEGANLGFRRGDIRSVWGSLATPKTLSI